MLGAGWTYSEYSAGQNEGPEAVSGLFAFIPPPKGSGCSRSGYKFADSRGVGVLPNAIDVLSNLAFLIAGAFGLRLASRAPLPQQASLHLFAMGLVLTALGSAYYHWAPTDKTLLWDRLPMTLAFAGAIGAKDKAKANLIGLCLERRRLFKTSGRPAWAR
jgi:hypothetical protein